MEKLSNLVSFTSLSLLRVACQKKSMEFLLKKTKQKPTTAALKNSTLHTEQGKWSFPNTQNEYRRTDGHLHHTQQESNALCVCPELWHQNSCLVITLQHALASGFGFRALLPTHSGAPAHLFTSLFQAPPRESNKRQPKPRAAILCLDSSPVCAIQTLKTPLTIAFPTVFVNKYAGF